MSKLNQIREESPLVVCYTNDVVKNFTANGLLSIGASPAMSEEPEEALEFSQVAGAFLINIGTITADRAFDMKEYTKIMHEQHVPVVLDPVAVGASTLRKTFCTALLNDEVVDVIRGNASEILSLIDDDAKMKGTDSDDQLDHVKIAKKAHQQLNLPIVLTGKVDVIACDNKVLELENGSEMLTKVTGGGCLLGAIVAAFIANEKKITIEILEEALSTYNIASEIANDIEGGNLPGSFQMNFIDQLNAITHDKVLEMKKVKEVK
ncbi:hydroxyethylthiazole kinase [Mammaliicoccus stepanovicii]|uniref:Hydroxyethylthiazole kinase n=1 Tax=Mammaliicoccus stepanovicii TaxID=643214 RepID=A0A239YQR8_9STAP|nr:hydroxyethylthiazole kinase [Mammaliicoccus stepanovicii]PNZ78939.1 hydroxyethylthiazole kinase [Mammaliicoccus stepanovicii]GGI41277.1 hydroxyethylthiazole kinase [Mammaliicoccus stepanovicii]SNV60568.1 hydroxyethylthiazole kinase [Mammaliicoccus stepanovicii]